MTNSESMNENMSYEESVRQAKKIVEENPRLRDMPMMQTALENDFDGIEDPMGLTNSLVARLEDIGNPLTAEEINSAMERAKGNMVEHSPSPETEHGSLSQE